MKRRAPGPPGGRGIGEAEENAGEDDEEVDIAARVQRAVKGPNWCGCAGDRSRGYDWVRDELGAMSDRMDRLDGQMRVAEAQRDTMGVAQEELKNRVHELNLQENNAELARLRASAARLETEVALVREPEPPERAADIANELEFHRVADPTFLRLQTRQAVQYDNVLAPVKSVTKELAIPSGGPQESWRMQGSGVVSNKVVVQVVGRRWEVPGAGKRCCRGSKLGTHIAHQGAR